MNALSLNEIIYNNMWAFLFDLKVILRKALYSLQYKALKRERELLRILTSEMTVRYILENRCSVCRYGDGEIDMITCLEKGFDVSRKSDFQSYNEGLAKRLKQILWNDSEKKANILICIPFVWKDHRILTSHPRHFIERSFVNNHHTISSFVNIASLYGDSYFTRFYMDMREKKKGDYVQLLRQIWDNRDLCLVEGEQSRLGVGNDLFLNSKSVKRILCPAIDAFCKYEEIIAAVRKIDKTNLILVALGQTATVLSYDLAMDGYQAIDIGHIDVEYEWFLMKAKYKVPIPNKYVNEIQEGRRFTKENDEIYLSQIVSRIE